MEDWRKTALKRLKRKESMDFEKYIFYNGGLPLAVGAEIKRRLLTAKSEQDVNSAFEGVIVDEAKSDSEIRALAEAINRLAESRT